MLAAAAVASARSFGSMRVGHFTFASVGRRRGHAVALTMEVKAGEGIIAATVTDTEAEALQT